MACERDRWWPAFLSISGLHHLRLLQAPEAGRYWALLRQWVGSMKGWDASSKLLVLHDNAESILSEPAGKKVR